MAGQNRQGAPVGRGFADCAIKSIITLKLIQEGRNDYVVFARDRGGGQVAFGEKKANTIDYEDLWGDGR